MENYLKLIFNLLTSSFLKGWNITESRPIWLLSRVFLFLLGIIILALGFSGLFIVKTMKDNNNKDYSIQNIVRISSSLSIGLGVAIIVYQLFFLLDNIRFFRKGIPGVALSFLILPFLIVGFSLVSKASKDDPNLRKEEIDKLRSLVYIGAGATLSFFGLAIASTSTPERLAVNTWRIFNCVFSFIVFLLSILILTFYVKYIKDYPDNDALKKSIFLVFPIISICIAILIFGGTIGSFFKYSN